HRIARPPVGRFLTHPPRPYLPPFPTRRSSDLPDELGKGPPVETRTSALHPGSTIRSARGSTNCPAAPSESASASAATSRRKPAPDRKSTRLNSSHVKISYAVFCLKKKQVAPQA